MASKTYRRFSAWWVNHPGADLLLIGLVLVAVVVTDSDLLGDTTDAARHGWYQTMAGLSGGLLGVAVASATILYAVAPGDRLRKVMGGVGEGLVRLFVSSTASLAVAAFGFALALPLDRTTEPTWVAVVATGLFVLVALRTGRLLWLLGQVLAVISRDSAAPHTTAWVAPRIEPGDYAIAPRPAAPEPARDVTPPVQTQQESSD